MRKTVHSPKPPVRAGARSRPGDDWSLYGRSGERKYLTPQERRRFMAAAGRRPAEVRTLCLTLAHTGCRLSEALALTGAEIDRDGGNIAFRCLKKRGRLVVRLVPVPPAFLRTLAQVHRQALRSPSERLWSWHRTRAWQLVKEVMREARLDPPAASPKGLRHAFGVHAVLSGVPLPLVQKWLGHEDIATTAIYTNVMGREERRIARRMW
ncbi:tyrosine-type recombinase/integrase [Methylosinus sporium]|uniref:Tyrosine-type recombinase/integrase n=1 Tax=Methylosinus sporium TaxID=428 RepID=A0A549T6T7_METSR|nr:tyrosine-type recombinase/integrase [Methylosinus sporium]TRL37589.1 tyrosine-type recombinase/integrase [Methylosinus sporium]